MRLLHRILKPTAAKAPRASRIRLNRGTDFEKLSHLRACRGPSDMKKSFAIVLGAAFLLCAGGAGAASADVRIGVGTIGPISPQTEADIDALVDHLPGIKSVPIQPPGDVDACVKRFVAGEADDRLDAVMVVTLPADAFHVQQGEKEATFTGTYKIWTLNLSTLAEDHHTFTFTDSETVISGPAAILSIPAQLFVERATGKQLISSSAWQAWEAVQARVEAKLIAASKLYLSTAPIRDTKPLNMLETAQALVDRGDADTALMVFRTAGVNNPEVQRLLAQAQEKMRRAKAQALLGRTLGAMAGGSTSSATTILAEYQKEPTSEPARADAIRRTLATQVDRRADSAYHKLLQSDVPGLDHAAFVAMLKQMVVDETGSAPDEVVVSPKDVTIEDKDATKGVKTSLDSYAAAIGKAAWLMSLKCGCDAAATLTADPSGNAILRARFAPSFTKPQVGLP
jgi:hypothetical protein